MEQNKEVDAYIAGFPLKVQNQLQSIRMCIQKAVPKAEEVISYGMPAYKQGKVLVYFAGYKNHIGFYPTGSGISAFQKEISKYKNSKGAVQFPIDKPIPKTLVTQMTKFRLAFEKEKEKEKQQVGAKKKK
jgi:uncharacterized protein YdhG (YjbR/CyaY superfamily)